MLESSYGSWPYTSRPLSRRRSARSDSGFTLLEILVVLLIVALVAAVVVGPDVFRVFGTAKSEAAKVQIERIASSLDLFRLEVGRYPTQEEGLEALIEAPTGLNRWNGPYLKKRESIIDPWGQEFVYRFPGTHGDYDLLSYGADKVEGGEGEARDIANW